VTLLLPVTEKLVKLPKSAQSAITKFGRPQEYQGIPELEYFSSFYASFQVSLLLIVIQYLFLLCKNLISNRHIFILTEKGKDGKGFKNSCENYPFKDYHWKSGIKNWILALWTTVNYFYKASFTLKYVP
jgi:hypothetical protein